MEIITIKDEYIKLGQALKLSGMVSLGSDAKMVIMDGLVQVNGETELRRGRKVVPGDVITFEGESVRIQKRS